ncbi:hypothetical protein BKI52_17515 [marine bacterium AO1-C]|nr:hypothetical protein BKI52_17515 [marine bacterium AO1-C]
MKLYTTQQSILLNEQPLGSGAEGNVYEIVAPQAFKGLVVKVYHSHEQSKDREPKIVQLIEAEKSGVIPPEVIFPKQCVYDLEGCFVGFIMPKVEATYHLTSLCSLSLNASLPQKWHNKYHRNDYNLYFRLNICRNLARLVAQIHQSQHYTFADLKPENIKVNWQGEVFILDIDSIQVTDNEQALVYPAEKITPEYAPPEAKHFNFKENKISESWDAFSLGVIFYKILLGLHPYTGTCLPPFEDLVLNEQKIQANLLPIGKQATYFDIIPEPHQAFEQLPQRMQLLLKASFQAKASLRPTAAYWYEALEAQLKQMNEPKVKEYAIAKAPPVRVTTPDKQTKSLLPNSRQAQRDVARLVAANLSAFIFLLALIKFVSLSGLFQGSIAKPLNESVQMDCFKPVPVDMLGRIEVKRHEITNKVGLFGRNGEMLLPYDYEWIGGLQEGLASIVLYNKTGYVNEQGKIVIPMVYDEGWAFSNGFARVGIKEKRGMINHAGELLTPLMYDNIWNFDLPTNGLARIEKDGKYGFIDQKGQEVIPVQFDWVDDFAGSDFTTAKKGGKTYKINRMGKNLGEIKVTHCTIG